MLILLNYSSVERGMCTQLKLVIPHVNILPWAFSNRNIESNLMAEFDKLVRKMAVFLLLNGIIFCLRCSYMI